MQLQGTTWGSLLGPTCGQLRLRRSPLRCLVLLSIGHIIMRSIHADDQLFAYAMVYNDNRHLSSNRTYYEI